MNLEQKQEQITREQEEEAWQEKKADLWVTFCANSFSEPESNSFPANIVRKHSRIADLKLKEYEKRFGKK